MEGHSAAPTRTWRVFQVPQGLDEPEGALRERACRRAGLEPADLRGFRIARRALDARRRGGERRLAWVVNADLVVDARLARPGLARACKAGRVRETEPPGSLRVARVDPRLRHVVVVGAGPAGLFAAHLLAENGVAVTLVERGPRLEERGPRVVAFHRRRVPDPEGNLLFGEGGAGTYSDGKIYTRVDDPLEVPLLEELVACGAPPEIVYDSLAHIGTDRLHRVLPRLRGRLEERGVRFLWDARLDGLELEPGPPARVVAARTTRGSIACDALVLAPGHSARDTWAMLVAHGVPFEAKPFQLGLRIEHPQELIDRARWGGAPQAAQLGAASYNLARRGGRGARAAHTFCMCPGGRIVASVHAPGLVCTNGMSNSKHSSAWASSAVVATLDPDDFGRGAFDGVELQERLERAAFAAGGGDYTAPAQTAADFLAGRETAAPRRSTYPFGTLPGRLDRLLPPEVSRAVARALEDFDRRVPGFGGPEGLLVGVETRSSGPVRIPREGPARAARGFANLHPVGEGAGWAGGIMSAALDGARTALALAEHGVLA